MYENNTVVLFGITNQLYPIVERISNDIHVQYFSDNNSDKWGYRPYNDERICIAPEKICKLSKPFIIIMVVRKKHILDIEKQCREMKIPFCHISEILNIIQKRQDAFMWLENIQYTRIHRFIDFELSETSSCNFHCDYCIVWRKQDFRKKIETSKYLPSYIRKAFSIERLGGPCLINICARGETLLSRDIVKLVYELLEEGHYLMIVTNCTITKRINEILNFSDNLLSHLFFKISFHFNELIKHNLMDEFWDNVQKIKASPCSYTLEITPSDELAHKIPEIIEIFNDRENGAMPHISIARDSTKKGLDLLSQYSLEEYKSIWGQFHSKMFELKYEWFGKKIEDFCCAGNWSWNVNAFSGNIRACNRKDFVCNVLENVDIAWPCEMIGRNCILPYCFNNHAFLALGCVPGIDCYNYLDMRDREDSKKEHWVKPPMSNVFKQKLYDNNFAKIEHWPDYSCLFQKERRAAIILFNSPDYSNLGDHAIALAEKKFCLKYFPEYDFIEVACEEYDKEVLKIKKVIKKEDILFITGGGNMGSLYLNIEDKTRHIISTFTENRIIIFPQTMYFEKNDFGRNEQLVVKEIYNNHPFLCVAMREEQSYHLSEEIFAKEVKKLLVPDMALFLDKPKIQNRKGALVCIRDDRESSGVDCERIVQIVAGIYDLYEEISTVNREKTILLHNREKEVYRMLNKIAGAELVITDRLHCMIFCAISCTPCIVFNNATGKNYGVLKWLKEFYFIKGCDSADSLSNVIYELQAISEDTNQFKNPLISYFENFVTEIKTFI